MNKLLITFALAFVVVIGSQGFILEAIVFGVGLIMGIITSIAGGGSIVAVPVLLMMGIPPINVLALNRTGDLAIVLGATRNYRILIEKNWWPILFSVFPLLAGGAFLGANFAQLFTKTTILIAVTIAVTIGLYFLYYPIRSLKNKMSSIKASCFLFGVGAWSGAIGIAGGTFGTLVIARAYRKKLLEARAINLMAAIPETIVSVTVLVSHSSLNWVMLLLIFSGSAIGAHFGSQLAIRGGDSHVKPVMAAVSIGSLIKTIFS